MPAQRPNPITRRRWSFDQFIIDEANALVDDGSEKFGIVRLQLVRVAEEHVRLVRDEFIYRHFFHTQQHIAVAHIGHNLDAKRAVFLILNPSDPTRFHHQLHFGVERFQIRTLGRGEGHPLVGRHFSFSENTNLHETKNRRPVSESVLLSCRCFLTGSVSFESYIRTCVW